MKLKIKKYLQPKEIYGIELSENNIINVALVNKKKGLVDYSTNKYIDDLSNLIPIVLVVNNSNCIQRIIENHIPIELAIGKILPSAKIDDFLYQEKTISNNEKSVSIIRKKSITDQLHFFEKNNFKVIRVYLNDNTQENYDKKSIAELITQWYWDDKEAIKSYVNTESELMHKKAFNLLSKVISLLFFSLLLVNFIIFNHYSEKEIRLANNLSKYKEIINQESVLKEQIEKQKKFASNQTKLSYYADQIAATTPKNIQLLKLEILSNKQENNSPQNNHIIVIEGKASAKRLSEWIKALHKKLFVESVEIEDFQNKTFELKIKTNDD
ncbi:hypothetical protein N9H19_03360 [Flavobacteriales bacterium]|nr:hypothetical protein [Flavobacteriales bacterium]